jgi:molecular chaperone GrpE
MTEKEHDRNVEVLHTEAENEAGEGRVESDEIVKLKQALEEKTREAAEAQDRYLRTYADFDNYRRRMQRDLVEFRKYANEQLAAELLTVVDHLGLALTHAEKTDSSIEGLRQGVELVYKQLRDALEKFSIKPFASEGEPFDPVKHDAILQVPRDDIPENTVVQVLQEGYLYHEKVLRHARVGVSKKPSDEEKKTEKS